MENINGKAMGVGNGLKKSILEAIETALKEGQKLPIHNVVKPKETVCEHTDTYYDDRNLGVVCKKCRCVIPD